MNIMILKRKILITSLLAFLMSSSPVLSQIDLLDPRIEMIRIELTRTQRLIAQVAEAIHSTDNPIAAVTLEKAMQVQNRAKAAFLEQTEIGFKTALILTMKARELAKAALSNLRQTDQFEGAVARKLERAQELLTRAGEFVGQSRSDDLRTLFEASRVNLQRGWEFYRNRRYRPAVKLADQVEKTARRILHMVGGGDADRRQYERRWETIQTSLKELSRELESCESTLGEQLVTQAQAALKQAQEMAEAGRWQNGLRLLQKARTLAQRAIQECQGDQRLRLKHEQLKSEADRLAEQIQRLDGTKREAAQHLLEQARDQLRMATDFYEEQKLEAARASLKGAQLALRRIKRYLGGTE